LNSRLDSIQAAILRVKLSHLDEAVAERRNLAAYYREALAGSGYLIQAPIDGSEHSYHLFVIQARDRTTTLESFQLAGIGVGLHYPLSVHEMAPYRFLDRVGELTVSERVCSSVISLPLYPGLPPHVQELVTDILVGSSAPD
jgi:aminotransferase EvaB